MSQPCYTCLLVNTANHWKILLPLEPTPHPGGTISSLTKWHPKYEFQIYERSQVWNSVAVLLSQSYFMASNPRYVNRNPVVEYIYGQSHVIVQFQHILLTYIGSNEYLVFRFVLALITFFIFMYYIKYKHWSWFQSTKSNQSVQITHPKNANSILILDGLKKNYGCLGNLAHL